jgi:hypothetical protein
MSLVQPYALALDIFLPEGTKEQGAALFVDEPMTIQAPTRVPPLPGRLILGVGAAKRFPVAVNRLAVVEAHFLAAAPVPEDTEMQLVFDGVRAADAEPHGEPGAWNGTLAIGFDLPKGAAGTIVGPASSSRNPRWIRGPRLVTKNGAPAPRGKVEVFLGDAMLSNAPIDARALGSVMRAPLFVPARAALQVAFTPEREPAAGVRFSVVFDAAKHRPAERKAAA